MDPTGTSTAPETMKSTADDSAAEAQVNNSPTEEEPAQPVPHCNNFSESPSTNSTDSNCKVPRAAANGTTLDENAADEQQRVDEEMAADEAAPTSTSEHNLGSAETDVGETETTQDCLVDVEPAANDDDESCVRAQGREAESASVKHSLSEQTSIDTTGDGDVAPLKNTPTPEDDQPSSDSDDDEGVGPVVEVAPEAMPPLPPPPHSPPRAVAVVPELSDPIAAKPPPQSLPPAGPTGSSRPPAAAGPDSSLRSAAAGPDSSLRSGAASPDSSLRSAAAGSGGASAVVPLLLLSLPVDSLHCIASFLTPGDWSNLGLASRGANLACKEVFRRVRMHGFRCATEVVTAWARGEHADARELAALYIKSGVPIYPLCLGHSYQTLTWRMGVEAREMDSPSGAESGRDEAGREGNASAVNENLADGNTGGDASSSSTQSKSNGGAKLDRFYTERYEARTQDGYFFPSMTYLEEKCLFWKYRSAKDDDSQILSPERRHSLTNAIQLRPPAPPMPGDNQSMGGPALPPRIGFPDLTHLAAAQAAGGGPPPGGAAQPPFIDPRAHHSLAFNAAGGGQSQGLALQRRTLSSSNLAQPYSKPLQTPRRPKMAVRVHKHLADHHLLGQRTVNDEDGAMKTAPLSLSVDFFHPHLTSSTAAAAVYPSDMVSSPYDSLNGPEMSPYQPGHPFGPAASPSPLWSTQWPQPGAAGAALGPDIEGGQAAAEISPPQDNMTLHQQLQVGVGTGEVDLNAAAAGLVPPPLFAPTGRPTLHQLQHAVSFGPGPMPDAASLARSPTGESSIVTDVSLEVYSSSSSGLPKAVSHYENHSVGDAGRTGLRNLRSRFSSYQRKLDSHLSHYQSSAFDECLLDFWDELLPLTAGVHYYDGHTPVPRMTSLHRFLTSPCPKSLGIVQCEIERIKISSKKKGVKGRLFPSYEYRLFIRDRRHGSSESQIGPTDGPPRSDTVLMTAMNKGKNHLGIAGVSPASSSSKRGVNNYYIYLPQQSDVDMHFKSVNDPSVMNYSPQPRPFQKLSPVGSGGASPFELGRLQSNFIGTEFQIFSPCIKKKSSVSNPARSRLDSSGDSDNEFDGGSQVSRETAESIPTSNPRRSRRRSSGIRRRLSRRSLSRGRRGSNASAAAEADDSSVGSAPGRTRRGSWPTLRPSRRAIANSIDSPAGQGQSCQPVMGEEENGAITYTANLLGNRPRIMDVCIPKVLEDGSIAPEWRRYCESSLLGDDDKAESMMNRFKQLQQQMDNPDAGNNENPADSRATPDDFGLMALQNRPPWWNVELGAFVLNFGGRVSVASVKNFQLCDRSDQEHIMLQFGRITGRHSFTMDFQYPLSATQAFAIAISSLQSKISFG